jgi:hypothetical protein
MEGASLLAVFFCELRVICGVHTDDLIDLLPLHHKNGKGIVALNRMQGTRKILQIQRKLWME